jgi:6-phosphogluconolactonase
MGTSPSCLAFNADKTRLYSGNETERVGENEGGTVSAFAIDPKTGDLKLLNTVSSGGKGPAHLSVHPSGKFVLVANYFGGSVAVLPIKADGSLGEATEVKKDAGKIGPTKATNAASRQLCHQRTRSDACAHDRGRSFGEICHPRRSRT